jgi:predicted AAA+ superfamily ATPase
VVLVGPRQVGKTVLLLQVADELLAGGWPAANITYFDFSDDRLSGEVSARDVAEVQPVGAADDIPQVLLLDEITRAHNWDLWLKQEVDAGGRRRILATDSAASVLRRGGQESGLGRWDDVHLEPLSLREFARFYGPRETAEQVLQRIPNLHERYLALGGFPEHATSDDPSEVRRRLRMDIVECAVLRDLAAFGVDLPRVKELFVYLVEDSGAILNTDKRADDLRADPRSVREWLRLLTETAMLVALPRHGSQASARLRARPKVYAADPGIVSAFALLAVGDERVRAQQFEAAVFRHLRGVLEGLQGELAYYRAGDELEIDFVVEMPKGRLAVEVTSSRRLRGEKLEKFRRAGRRLKADRLLLVHGGALEQEKLEEVTPVPLPRFLLSPESYLKEDLDD